MFKKFYTFIFIALFPLSILRAQAPSLDKCTFINCEIAERKVAPPRISVEESTSKNWSGYAAVTNLKHPKKCVVDKVLGVWQVPAVTGNDAEPAYSSIWVGMDGYASGTVEQIGTEQDWDGASQVNYAWFEMYPRKGHTIVGFPVDVGDLIYAQVRHKKNEIFELLIANLTKNVYTIVPQKYTKSCKAKRKSAEWIVEAPSVGNTVLPLANFGTAEFLFCEAKINGQIGAIDSPNWKNDPITMKEGSTIKAVPSALVPAGSGSAFTVTWEHQ